MPSPDSTPFPNKPNSPTEKTLLTHLRFQLRLSIGAFMKELSVQGAFYNYKVVCDASTTTANDIAKGIVNVEILFGPVKPAEFVVLKFQQTAAVAS